MVIIDLRPADSKMNYKSPGARVVEVSGHGVICQSKTSSFYHTETDEEEDLLQ